MKTCVETILLFGMAVAITACASRTLRSHQVVCSQTPSGSYASVDQVSSEEWLGLLMDEDQHRMDCSGHSMVPTELPLRCVKAAPYGAARNLPIRADELNMTNLSNGFGLLWLPVEEFSNGDRTLLVALVHTSKQALSVVGIGAVRLPAQQTRLELQAVRGEELLFARGAECASREDAGRCDRRLKLLLLHEGRFVPLELRDADNRCHGEAVVDLARSQELRVKSGWTRRFDLISTYEVTDDGLVINEQLVAMDRPPDGNEDTARLFRKSDARRVLEFTGAYFIYTRESLWTGMREVRGDLQINESQSIAR